MKHSIVILLKGHKSLDERDKQANPIIDELREKGFTDLEYKSGSTFIKVHIKGGINDLNDAARRILFEVHNIWFYVVPDYIGEVSDAIEKREYFKAFTLCVSLYESFGKYILIRYFNKNNLNREIKVAKELTARKVIDMLYNKTLIEKSLYDDMITVNKIRNNLTHTYLDSIMEDELLKKIEENIPKVRTSLESLIQIHETP